MLVKRENIECKGNIRRKHNVKLYLSQKVPRQRMTSAVLFAPVMFISVRVSVSRKNTTDCLRLLASAFCANEVIENFHLSNFVGYE